MLRLHNKKTLNTLILQITQDMNRYAKPIHMCYILQSSSPMAFLLNSAEPKGIRLYMYMILSLYSICSDIMKCEK